MDDADDFENPELGDGLGSIFPQFVSLLSKLFDGLDPFEDFLFFFFFFSSSLSLGFLCEVL
jgi:hypothetical protein